MAEEDLQRKGPALSLVHDRAPAPSPRPVPLIAFDRHELHTILNLYGRKVAAGEWRDYAMDFLRERAVFSVFARASERPLYTIEKTPKLRNRQGMYMVVATDGRILRRGHALETVLAVLERKLALVQ